MSRIIRERNGAGFWHTRVIEPFASQPKTEDSLEKPILHPRGYGTRAMSSVPVSPLVRPILNKLHEYEATGLTVDDLATMLNTSGGHIRGVLLTMCSAGLVVGDRTALSDNGRRKRRVIQWRIRPR